MRRTLEMKGDWIIFEDISQRRLWECYREIEEILVLRKFLRRTCNMYMHHNPQYRPPCGLRATAGAARSAHVGGSGAALWAAPDRPAASSRARWTCGSRRGSPRPAGGRAAQQYAKIRVGGAAAI